MPETKLKREGQERLHKFVHEHMNPFLSDPEPSVCDFAEELLTQLDKAHAAGNIVPYLRMVGRMALDKGDVWKRRVISSIL